MTKYEPVFWDIETTGLNPLHQDWYDDKPGAQVICVVFGRISGWRHTSDYDKASYEVKVLWDSDEYRLLQNVHDWVETVVNEIQSGPNNTEAVLAGWNSRQYDHPYIGARYARLRLDGSVLNHRCKRLDMMRALGNDEIMGKTYPGQDDYAKRLGIDVNDEITGADMVDAFGRDDWDMIAEHGEDDVREMMKVFVERKEQCWEELYRHYDGIDGHPPKFGHKGEF